MDRNENKEASTKSSQKASELIRDQQLPWNGPFPYDWLNRRLGQVGKRPLDPSATFSQINEAFFDLMAAGPPSDEDRRMWDSLRLIEERLLIDFLMYPLPAGSSQSFTSELWERPIPVAIPDMQPLIEDDRALAKVLCPPSSFQANDPPSDLSAEDLGLKASPLDIGPLFPRLESLLEETENE